MNKKESWEFYTKGKNAWNEWAKGMLTKRKSAEDDGTWVAKETLWSEEADVNFCNRKFVVLADFSGFIFPGDAAFLNATFSEGARFNSATFVDSARFSAASFSGDTGFNSTTFNGYALFDNVTISGDLSFTGAKFRNNAVFENATFSGDAEFFHSIFSRKALFYGATFLNDAKFNDAKFSGDAQFTKARFSGRVWFIKTIFSANANFISTNFEGISIFEEAKFIGNSGIATGTAYFTAARSADYFSLEGTSFENVPYFDQTRFDEAPTLDNIIVNPSSHADDSRYLPSRWRHLRRLATQGYDHERERDFFAEEIKSRRSVFDFWNGRNCGRWWTGILYQGFSDFGRSLTRPLFWFLGSVLAFAHSYIFVHILQRFGAETALLDAQCFNDYGNPFRAALNLSFARSSVVGSIWARDGVTRALQCLYNTDNGPFMAGEMVVHLPSWVVASGYLQTLFSAVMIFLFLLAVRNHFRIR